MHNKQKAYKVKGIYFFDFSTYKLTKSFNNLYYLVLCSHTIGYAH